MYSRSSLVAQQATCRLQEPQRARVWAGWRADVVQHGVQHGCAGMAGSLEKQLSERAVPDYRGVSLPLRGLQVGMLQTLDASEHACGLKQGGVRWTTRRRDLADL